MTSPSRARDPRGWPGKEDRRDLLSFALRDGLCPARGPGGALSHPQPRHQRGVLLSSALTTNVHRLAEVDAACGGRESWGVGRTRATRYKRLHRRSSAGWSSRHLACPLKAVVLAAPAN